MKNWIVFDIENQVIIKDFDSQDDAEEYSNDCPECTDICTKYEYNYIMKLTNEG